MTSLTVGLELTKALIEKGAINDWQRAQESLVRLTLAAQDLKNLGSDKVVRKYLPQKLGTQPPVPPHA